MNEDSIKELAIIYLRCYWHCGGCGAGNRDCPSKETYKLRTDEQAFVEDSEICLKCNNFKPFIEYVAKLTAK